MAVKKHYDNKEIRAYLRANPHYTDSMVADHFNVSLGVISANKTHITMGTDTDNPQERAKPHYATKSIIKQLTLIKAPDYNLLIDENGNYRRLDLKTKKLTTITDDQAKAIMLNRLHENYNQ